MTTTMVMVHQISFDMPVPLLPQHHWYPWSSDARRHGDEPEAAECGVCGV